MRISRTGLLKVTRFALQRLTLSECPYVAQKSWQMRGFGRLKAFNSAINPFQL